MTSYNIQLKHVVFFSVFFSELIYIGMFSILVPPKVFLWFSCPLFTIDEIHQQQVPFFGG